MTRSHKIGWLVLAVALLFVLWKLPRLHGQGFGSFSHDQPFLASSSASLECTFPQDSMSSYAADATLNGLDGGCLWNGAYLAITYTNVAPIIVYEDANAEYTDGANLGDINAGTNWIYTITAETFTKTNVSWTNVYVWRTYEDMQNLRYVDAMDEYTDTADLNDLAGGTNYYASQITNAFPSTRGWTNVFVVH